MSEIRGKLERLAIGLGNNFFKHDMGHATLPPVEYDELKDGLPEDWHDDGFMRVPTPCGVLKVYESSDGATVVIGDRPPLRFW